MEQIFLRLVSMGLSAGWLVAAVVVLRAVLKKTPRRIVCLLWALVALRLLVPVQIAWRASLMPPQATIEQAARTTFAAPAEPSAAAPNETAPAAPTETAPAAPERVQTLSRVWIAGALAMLLWAAVSAVRLRLRLRTAVRQEDNIWLSAEIDTPFVLGLIRPRIYLPPGLDETQRAHVLAHERAHIARGDYLWKPLGWLLLSVYWFQPLLWLAYVLLCRDLELACDERVARGLDRAGRADYAEALLDSGSRRRRLPVAPVAFGEVSVKARVRAVLRYRKPVFLQVAVALLVVAAAGAFFLTERPADALAQSETPTRADHSAAVAEQKEPEPMPEPEESEPPEPTPVATPYVVPSGGTTAYVAPQQTQYTADTSASDTQAQIDAIIRAQTEKYIQENRAYIEANQARSSTQQTQQTYGYQSALNVQPTTPQVLVAGADGHGNVGGGVPNPGVVQNGDTTAIRIW